MKRPFSTRRFHAFWCPRWGELLSDLIAAHLIQLIR